MKNTVARIAPLIVDQILSSQYNLRSYSEYAHDYLYNECIGEHREATRGHLTFVRAGNLQDKADNPLIIDLRCAVDGLLESKGYEQSEFGFWHKKGDRWYVPFEDVIRKRFSGAVLSYGQEAGGWMTGEAFLSNWEDVTPEYPSSPLEAVEFWLSDPEIDFYGPHETEWGYVLDSLREQFEELDLTEMEDVDEALERLDCGLCLSDFPIDYQESVTRAFEVRKSEQCVERDYEEEYE